MRKLAYIIMGLTFIVFIILLTYTVYPICASFETFSRLRTISKIGYAKDYYAILSPLLRIVITFMGLMLGYFYYINRAKYDAKKSKRDREREQLKYMLEKLDKYDENVDLIIFNRFSDEKELHTIRTKIQRSFEHIELLIETHENILGFTDNDINTFLKLNSYVDKNDKLMHDDFSAIDNNSYDNIRDEYISLIQDARKICYNKIS